VGSVERDEPYQAAFDACSCLEPLGFTLFVSGNYRRAGVEPARFPWVRFLGYVSEAQYYAYLASCAVAMDLTTLEDCLLCGAYEAVAAAKPLVISNTRALADYFGATVVLTENAPEAIAASIQRAHAQRDELAHMTREWSGRNEVFMAQRIATLQDALRALCAAGSRTPAKRVAS
jgi:glycosyltransferase involved in cell wall biosynthesis